MTRPPKPLAFAVIVMSYLPFVAVLVLIGYFFSWRFPVAVIACMSVVSYRALRQGHRPALRGRGRTTAEVLAFALLGSIVGGLLFGGMGVIFGFAIGFIARLAEVPITRRRSA
ncbi:MAG TPA: hypothetical protein VEH55_11805 [Gaiellaceae bacterium]|nr:hypothetical protein [Gaiellaceae bacterium]